MSSRVATIHHSAQRGGAENALLRLVSALPAGMFEPVVLVPEEGPLSAEHRFRGHCVRGIRLNWWMMERAACFSEASLAEAFGTGLRKRVAELELVFAEERIDLVHTNTAVIAEGALAAARVGLPHVWHPHEPFRVSDYYVSATDAENLEELMAQLSDAIVAPSSYLAGHFRSETVRSLCRIVNEPCDDQGALSPGSGPQGSATPGGAPMASAPSASDGRIRLLHLGAPTPRKAPLDLIHALAALPAEFSSRFSLTLIGDPLRSEYERRIASAVREAAMASAVRWLPFTGKPDALLAECDVLICCSRCDTFPLVAIEAMAAGRAVIATRSTGAAEAVVDGVTGLLVNPADPPSLAAAIRMMISDREMVRRMGAAGPERAKLYGCTVQAARLAAVWREALACRTQTDRPVSSDTSTRPRLPDDVVSARRRTADAVIERWERIAALLSEQRRLLTERQPGVRGWLKRLLPPALTDIVRKMRG